MKILATIALFSVCASTAQAKALPSVDAAKRTLRVVTGRPFEKRDARTRTLPVKGGGAFVQGLPMVSSTAVVGTATKHWGAPTDWEVVDLATGAKKAKVFDVGDSSLASHTAVVVLGDAAHHHQALLHLDDGRITEPHVELPDGGKVVDVRIALDHQRAVTWLFARRADGRPFHGQWKDTHQAKVALEDSMAFWPSHVSGENGIQAWTDEGAGAASGCNRVLVGPDDPLLCRPAATPGAPPYDVVEECIRADGDTWLVDDCSGLVPPPPCTIRSRLLSLSAQPARVLSVCEDAGTARFSLWSSARTVTWQLPTPPSWKSAILERGPRSSLALEALANPDEPVRHWLDTETGTLFEGPPLVQVALSEHRNDRRRLVQPPGKPNELWLLDLGAGTLERIADDIACEGRLHSYSRTGDRATIECLPKAALGNLYRDEQRLASWTWMEIIDLGRRIRWHTNEVFEAKLGTNVVVGTRRGKPAQIAVVETP